MRLIDADELKKDIMSYKTMPEIRKAICEVIDDAPTVTPTFQLKDITDEDVARFAMIWQRATSKGLILEPERPHGKWIIDDGLMSCSLCQGIVLKRHFDYCPNCGADMREDSGK